VVRGAIEIGGAAGPWLLLVPFALLAIVIIRASRTGRARLGRAQAPLRALPDAAPAEASPQASREEASHVPRPELARLYLAEAKEQHAAGLSDAAAERLRASIRAAAEGKEKGVEAEARLELADMAREAGDLTTACEHWQIARSLFREAGRKPELAETETLMRRHGCPTDWVLNDF